MNRCMPVRPLHFVSQVLAKMRTEILNVCGTGGSAVFSPTVVLCCTSRRSIRLAERGYSALARRDRWTDDGCEDPYRCGLKC